MKTRTTGESYRDKETRDEFNYVVIFDRKKRGLQGGGEKGREKGPK